MVPRKYDSSIPLFPIRNIKETLNNTAILTESVYSDIYANPAARVKFWHDLYEKKDFIRASGYWEHITQFFDKMAKHPNYKGVDRGVFAETRKIRAKNGKSQKRRMSLFLHRNGLLKQLSRRTYPPKICTEMVPRWYPYHLALDSEERQTLTFTCERHIEKLYLYGGFTFLSGIELRLTSDV